MWLSSRMCASTAVLCWLQAMGATSVTCEPYPLFKSAIFRQSLRDGPCVCTSLTGMVEQELSGHEQAVLALPPNL